MSPDPNGRAPQSPQGSISAISTAPAFGAVWRMFKAVRTMASPFAQKCA